MNYQTVSVLVFVSIVLPCAGCGTVENLQETVPTKNSTDVPWKTIYGGVRSDCTYFGWPVDPDSSLLTMTYCFTRILDIPFSVVGDTITLPYTLAYESGMFGVNILHPVPPICPEPPTNQQLP
jgi:uncharacterized protein YceK